jgi:DNA modification methylase
MIKILQGNCLDKLKELPDQSINTCITSPPYWGLRDYGEDKQLGMEDTPEEFVNNLVEVFREVKRVLRDDGTVWLNLGDTYSATRWSNTPSTTGISQSYSDIVLQKKTKLPDKNLVGIPWRVAFALQQDGWYLRQDIIWHKPNPMPESVKDRCTKAHEYIFLLSKSPKYYFDNETIKEESKTKWNSNKISKQIKIIETNKMENFRQGKGHHPDKVQSGRNKRSVWTVTTKPFKGAHFATFPMDLIEPCVLAGCPEKACVACGKPYERVIQKQKSLKVERNKRSGTDDRKIGGVLDKYNRENPPIDLGLEKQCNCETNETKSGTVLDPFGGSGTTGIVASNHNRKAVLIELNTEYIEIARQRIQDQGGLFTDLEILGG